MSDETKKTAKPVTDEAKAKPAAKKAAAKPAAKSASKSADKSASKSVAKPASKSTSKSADKPASKSVAKPASKSADKSASKSADKTATKSTDKTAAKSATTSTGKTATKSATTSTGKTKSTTITLDKGALDKSKAKAAPSAKADSKADGDANTDAKANSGANPGAKSKTKPEVEVKIVKSRAKKSASSTPVDVASPSTPDAPQTDAPADTKDTAPPQTQDQAQAVALDSETSTQASTNGAGGRDDKSGVSGVSPVYEVQIDSLGRAYATGRRKEASARVWIKPGSGRVSVNGRDVKIYFARPVLRMLLGQPFVATGKIDAFDVTATVKGGGLSGQAGAVRHGISHALVRFDPELRPRLKSGGFLTRDSRAVERKKYGRRKARRSFQFSKR